MIANIFFQRFREDAPAVEHFNETKASLENVVNSDDSASDDDLSFQTKKSRKLNRSAAIISDDSENENLEQDKNLEQERISDRISLHEDVSSGSEERNVIKSGVKKKRHKKKFTAFDDDSEDDAKDGNPAKTEKPRRGRKISKEKNKKNSKEMIAIQKLQNSRKRSNLKKTSVNDSKMDDVTDVDKGKIITDENHIDNTYFGKRSKESKDATEFENSDLKDQKNDVLSASKMETKSGSELSDTGSEDENEAGDFKWKTYNTRGKSPQPCESSDDEVEKDQKFKTEQILGNKDLFDADSESSELENEECNANDNDSDNESNKRKNKVM